MRVNLRKADKLYHLIVATLNTIETPLVVAVSEFEDPVAVVEKARREWQAAENIRMHLLGAMLEIRTKLGEANAEYGVNKILTEIANIEARLKIRETVYRNVQATQDMNIIRGRLKNISDVPAAERRRGYGNEETLRVNVLSMETLTALGKDSAKLRKQKELLKDELLSLNVSHNIELSEPVVTALQSINIL